MNTGNKSIDDPINHLWVRDDGTISDTMCETRLLKIKDIRLEIGAGFIRVIADDNDTDIEVRVSYETLVAIHEGFLNAR